MCLLRVIRDSKGKGNNSAFVKPKENFFKQNYNEEKIKTCAILFYRSSSYGKIQFI